MTNCPKVSHSATTHRDCLASSDGPRYAAAPHLPGDRLWGESGENDSRWGARGENEPRSHRCSRKPLKDRFRQLREQPDSITAVQSGGADNCKKISSWAAILFAPTLVGTIYGMNFDEMPELHWAFGYPFAILLMAAVCVSLYFIFKKRDWL
ncbi:CorA family divalent cation transporter [Streptomyces sp. NPDC005562]|uniref:CorA family divalent cation transporter n=1 Tax=Streptomyces sp. NPDC005562 TaxID=3154890 RepID=UPI0033BB775A